MGPEDDFPAGPGVAQGVGNEVIKDAMKSVTVGIDCQGG